MSRLKAITGLAELAKLVAETYSTVVEAVVKQRDQEKDREIAELKRKLEEYEGGEEEEAEEGA